VREKHYYLAGGWSDVRGRNCSAGGQANAVSIGYSISFQTKTIHNNENIANHWGRVKGKLQFADVYISHSYSCTMTTARKPRK